MSITVIRLISGVVLFIIMVLVFRYFTQIKRFLYKVMRFDGIPEKKKWGNQNLLFQLLIMYKFFFLFFYYFILLLLVGTYFLVPSLAIIIVIAAINVVYPLMVRLLFGLQLWIYKIKKITK